MPELSGLIEPSECVERVVSSQHIRADKTLKWQCLKPRANESGVSVIRQLIGDTPVKKTAQIVNDQTYAGLAEATAGDLVNAGLNVIPRQRPEDYLGHAEIEFPTYPAPLEPYEPQLAGDGDLAMVNYFKSHLRLFRFRPDSEPYGDKWIDDPLCKAC